MDKKEMQEKLAAIRAVKSKNNFMNLHDDGKNKDAIKPGATNNKASRQSTVRKAGTD